MNIAFESSGTSGNLVEWLNWAIIHDEVSAQHDMLESLLNL
jgi:hypothetical protein